MERERIIGGRLLERHVRPGMTIWQEILRPEPVTRTILDENTGENRVIVEHVDSILRWREVRYPEETIEQIMPMCWPDPCDIRPEDRLNDQLERAEAAGFDELATAFKLVAKTKPRESIRSLFPYGDIYLSRRLPSIGRDQAVSPDEIRAMILKHLAGDFGTHGRFDDVELTDDSRWCPVLFGQAVENRAAVEAGTGLVISSFQGAWDTRRRDPDEIRVATWLDRPITVVFCPRLV